MKYYLYKITNWFNGKIYVGAHKTEDLNDGYMGSGKVLRSAIKKYGLESFTKEILQVFDSAEEMFEAEAQVVNEEFVKDSMTYNLKLGGEGGWGYINSVGLNSRAGAILTEDTKDLLRIAAYGRPVSQETRLKISENNGMRNNTNGAREKVSLALKGKEKTEEHKRKLSEAALKFGKREIVICPHCNKSGGENAMKRYHFDNCKSK